MATMMPSAEELKEIEAGCLALVSLERLSAAERRLISNGDNHTYEQLEESMNETFEAMDWNEVQRPARE